MEDGGSKGKCVVGGGRGEGGIEELVGRRVGGGQKMGGIENEEGEGNKWEEESIRWSIRKYIGKIWKLKLIRSATQ